MSDTQNFQRFVTAQEANGTWERALSEIRLGRKVSHWMWFVFPQLEALGRSSAAKFYGLAGIDEARAYFQHSVLGPRLAEGMAAVLESGVAPTVMLGSIDSMKLRSCATLFMNAEPGEPIFSAVIEQCYDGIPDQVTLLLLHES